MHKPSKKYALSEYEPVIIAMLISPTLVSNLIYLKQGVYLAPSNKELVDIRALHEKFVTAVIKKMKKLQAAISADEIKGNPATLIDIIDRHHDIIVQTFTEKNRKYIEFLLGLSKKKCSIADTLSNINDELKQCINVVNLIMASLLKNTNHSSIDLQQLNQVSSNPRIIMKLLEKPELRGLLLKKSNENNVDSISDLWKYKEVRALFGIESLPAENIFRYVESLDDREVNREIVALTEEAMRSLQSLRHEIQKQPTQSSKRQRGLEHFGFEALHHAFNPRRAEQFQQRSDVAEIQMMIGNQLIQIITNSPKTKELTQTFSAKLKECLKGYHELAVECHKANQDDVTIQCFSKLDDCISRLIFIFAQNNQVGTSELNELAGILKPLNSKNLTKDDYVIVIGKVLHMIGFNSDFLQVSQSKK